VTRFVDVTNAVSEELEFDVVMDLNDFSDWNDRTCWPVWH
jgi:hypothetical protein